MTNRHVLITDITWSSTAIEEEVLGRVDADVRLASSGEENELLELAVNADAILTCFATVTPAVVRAAPRLQTIGRYGIGVDNIAVDTATGLGVPVTNVPAYCVDEVAEHVLALLLSLVRGLHRYDRAVREGDWSLTTGLPTRRVRGSVLGIVGFGHIGRALAKRADALGMQVLVHHPTGRAGSVELLELARRADFVSLHVPLNATTRGMIDAAFLRAMKPSAYLLNAARGALVDQTALAEALKRGELAGAGLDVFEPERLPPEHPLLNDPRVLATPHTAFYSEQSVVELARQAAENVAAILAGRRPASVVNAEVLELPRWARLAA